MKLLCEVPFNTLKVGDRIKSIITGRTGIIEKVIEKSRNGPEVQMLWDDSEDRALWWHYQLDKIEYLE